MSSGNYPKSALFVLQSAGDSFILKINEMLHYSYIKEPNAIWCCGACKGMFHGRFPHPSTLLWSVLSPLRGHSAAVRWAQLELPAGAPFSTALAGWGLSVCSLCYSLSTQCLLKDLFLGAPREGEHSTWNYRFFTLITFYWTTSPRCTERDLTHIFINHCFY